MNSNRNLSDYLNKFRNLKVYVNYDMYPPTGKAPNKPILLLSLMVLNKNDKIDLRDIPTDTDKEVNELLVDAWNKFWDCLSYEGDNYKCPGDIFQPIYAIDNNYKEEFLKINYNDGVKPRIASSWNVLNKIADKIFFEEELIQFFDDSESREKIKNALIHEGEYFDSSNEKALSEEYDKIDASL